MTTHPLPFPALARRTALWAAAVCLLYAAPLPAAEPEYTSLAGVKAKGFQKWIDDSKDQGYEPWYLNGYDVGDHAEFAGVAIKDPNRAPCEARFNLTSDECQQWFDEMRDKGYRPRSVCGYMDGKSPRFAGAFIKDAYAAKVPGWKTCVNQGQKDFEKTLSAMRDDGFPPGFVSPYLGPDGSVRYTALFTKRPPADKWAFNKDMTADEYQEQLDRWTAKDARLLQVAVYDTPDGQRFLAVAHLNDRDNMAWRERHDMSGDKYQKEFDKMAEDGFKPFSICGYRAGGEVRFAAIWTKKK